METRVDIPPSAAETEDGSQIEGSTAPPLETSATAALEEGQAQQAIEKQWKPAGLAISTTIQNRSITPLQSPGAASTNNMLSPTTRRKRGQGYSDANILKKGYISLLVLSTAAFGGLVVAANMELENERNEDFYYRMIVFAVATCCSCVMSIAALSVYDSEHAEKVSSAHCAAGLAFISCASHIIMGFQGAPLVKDFSGQLLHTSYLAEHISETFIILCIMEMVNWETKRGLLSICCQLGAVGLWIAGLLQPTLLLGLVITIAGLVLYAQIFYLWYNALKRFRANRQKRKKYRDPNLQKAFAIVNTYFMTQNAFIAITVLGLLGAYDWVIQSFCYSGLSLLTKIFFLGEY